MDAANLLKPALARGTLHCIGATTLNEYQKYIEKDAALERRFQPFMVQEPSLQDTIAILRAYASAMKSITALGSLKELFTPPRFCPTAISQTVFYLIKPLT